MKTTITFALRFLLLVLSIAVSACGDSDDDNGLMGNEGSISNPIALATDTPYWGTIANYPLGESYYSYTPGYDGHYTIALSDVTAGVDVDWFVVDYIDGSAGDPIVFCENDVANGDEICTVDLQAGTTVLFIVENFTAQYASFAITVSAP